MVTQHLFVMRHGSTDMNEAGIIQGRLDATLTPEGMITVKRHARFMASQAAGAWRILAGPLKRTRETAALAQEILGGSLDIEEALTEVGRGDLEGLPKKALPPPLDRVYSRFQADPWNERPPGSGAESFADVERRLASAAVPLIRSRLDAKGPLVVVTHGTVGKILVMLLCGLDRTFVDRVPSKHAYLHDLVFDGSSLSLSVLDGKSDYAPIDWQQLPSRSGHDA